MYNDGYHFWGMNFIWWGIFIVIFFWVFVTPYDIPGQRNKPKDPLDDLKRRYAKGEINSNEYKNFKAKLLN